MRPADLRYTESHEWIRVEGEVATVGITDFAVAQLTDIVYIELPAVGTNCEKGKALGEIESVKAVSDLFAPCSGTVEEVHETLPDNLDKLSSSPFGEGWLVKIKMTNPSDVESLLSAEAYEEIVKAEDH